MNNDQTNGDAKLSIAKNVAIWTGLIYSVGIVVFFANVSPNEDNFPGAKSIMVRCMYFTLVSNCVAFALWIFGYIQKRTRLTAVALILWNVPLNLWTGFTLFSLTIILVLERNFSIYEGNSDILIVTLTALFVALYIALIIIYRRNKRSAHKNTADNPQLRKIHEENSTFYWKCVAIAVDWLIMSVINIFLLGVFIWKVNGLIEFLLSLLGMVLNFGSAVLWLIGVNKNSTRCMLLPFVLWGLMLAIWIFIMSMIVIHRTETNTCVFIAATIFWIIVYFIAVLSFVAVLRADRKQTVQNSNNYVEIDVIPVKIILLK
ncbi:uncharacterized protein LOC129573398 [Sitodiplosis mosellana]|uniref:uncharacterized protein LOC129573398 n=1 Tax=Sitodiplosis mosellana TaxID=263140 RepID=UPI002444A040|nr:uncharacterized protein LOC129573398 [Sitodiplosis mosellana]XP_055309860.1 uncharacterized protein LOC129573398 [Sitodiplosis mosellana]XP_055309861.1 uncharacterized protein LOC129573398 [Sitodiplosis mosellana]XP_055309862.1 uncharacterized protein LOC129573398 [Sitodiplosis mosellana]XP_055309863.1 uncharacterized protein LOC129573398 [Sitodiplosis mosellana]XP_055309864.1 uncharacterized protein LOC129573398 [Sitodiplosis mosellana]